MYASGPLPFRQISSRPGPSLANQKCLSKRGGFDTITVQRSTQGEPLRSFLNNGEGCCWCVTRFVADWLLVYPIVSSLGPLITALGNLIFTKTFHTVTHLLSGLAASGYHLSCLRKQRQKGNECTSVYIRKQLQTSGYGALLGRRVKESSHAQFIEK